MRGTPSTSTDLYAGPTSGHLLTHKESIALFKRLGVKMTPELKAPSVTMPFNGFTREAYAQKMIDEYKEAGVSPREVWPQSFGQDDVLYWVRHEPAFGRQAVYLDDANDVSELPGFAELASYTSARTERRPPRPAARPPTTLVRSTAIVRSSHIAFLSSRSAHQPHGRLPTRHQDSSGRRLPCHKQ